MPPRVRSTQGARARAFRAGPSSPPTVPTQAVKIEQDEGSPDPLALTPVPTSRSRPIRSTRSVRSPSSANSSPAPTSTQAPSSEIRADKSKTTRLRSGRRSKGFTVDVNVLGEGDLVVPSDEEEYEAWIEGKKGESSKMAQERWARHQLQTDSPTSDKRYRAFLPLFSPGRVSSPPVESQEWGSSGYTTTTAPLSANNSSEDPFTVNSATNSVPDMTEMEIAIPMKDVEMAEPSDRSSGPDNGPLTHSQISLPRSTLEKIPRGPAMEDLDELETMDVEEIGLPEQTVTREVTIGPEQRETSPGDDHEQMEAMGDDDRPERLKDEILSLSAPLAGHHDTASVERSDRGPSDAEARTHHEDRRPGHSQSEGPPIDQQEEPEWVKEEVHTLLAVPVSTGEFEEPPSPSPDVGQACNSPRPMIAKQEPQSLKPKPDDLRRHSSSHVPSQGSHSTPTKVQNTDVSIDLIQKEEPESIKPTLDPTVSPVTPHRNTGPKTAGAFVTNRSQASTTGPMFTPATRLTPSTQNSPLLESQIGPHNTHLFGLGGNSPSPGASLQVNGVDRTSLPPSSPPVGMAEDNISGPEQVQQAGVADMRFIAAVSQRSSNSQPRASGQEDRVPQTSSPDAIDLLGMRSPSLTPLPDSPEPTRSAQPIPPPVESIPAVDPALERFRGARSFRTRTTLQLQPYTRERLLYEAALRKGGLTKGKRAIGAPRDISQPDDGDDAVRSDPPSTANQTDPEAIVIQPSPPPRPAPKPVEILEVDYYEYYILHDKRLDGREADLEERKELERIAKSRLDSEKAERRRDRETRKMQKQLERFRREQERGDPDDETYRPMPISTAVKRKATQGSKVARPSALGRTVTYSKRPRQSSRPAPEPTSESEASARVRLSNVSRLSPSVQPVSPPDLGGYGFGDGIDDPPSPGRPLPSPPRTISSGGRSNSDSDSSSDGREDSRAKVARKMLPAVMLRRLEQEAARKERDKQTAKRRKDRIRSPSPARPGRAVVRHGHGDTVEFSQFLDEVAAGPAGSSQSRDPTPEEGFESDVSARHRPISVNSSSDGSGSESGSQAEEDYGGHGGGGGGESLAQLYRGDFESLVAGKGRLPPKSRRNALDRLRGLNGATTSRRHRQSRPALGLKKQVTSSEARGRRAMYQSRLDFPADDRTPNAKSRKRSYQQTNTRTPTSARKDQPRPAIRLDDHVIFATNDFAFEDDDVNDIIAVDQETPRATKRAFGRTRSIPIAAREAETLDTGVGKARSWAYLDKLSVDFGISPLPSGLYCSAESIPGSGRLAELVAILNNKADVEVDACAAYGVELYPSLAVTAIQAVVSIIFDKVFEATTARILDREAPDVDIKSLRFLGAHLVTMIGSKEDLADDIHKGVKEISNKLDLLDLPVGQSGLDARQVVIKLRWALFELAVCLSPISTFDMVPVTAIPLITLLLGSGFDKAIRPLKLILRGESDTAEISNLSLTTWIATIQVLSHVHREDPNSDSVLECVTKALDSHYPHDQVGPLAAERIWYLVFGLCAVHQFDIHGCTSTNYSPKPQWTLVRRAIGLIKISHNEEAEEGAHLHQLQGRDRYIRVMLARCIRLSSVWQWPFDRESFSITTKDLGVIFKDRQYRNLPTEAPVDFPTFITSFDMTLTAALDSKRESAFELYLRLVCVAASDLISGSQDLKEAERAERDVQKLVSAIMPHSPVKFNRILPPTSRQLGQLINRYSTMVAATYFSPSLLSFLMAKSKTWVAFENADFDSRQVTIRGLMYVAVACRHHGQSLDLVVNRLAEILGLLQKEVDALGKGTAPVHAPSRLEVERTMVMVVSCVKQVILHHTFDPDQTVITYPDPSLLHESWTTCVFALDLSKDLKCSTEVVATIQAFLDARLNALPSKARRAREEKVESQDEFGSLGFELDDTTLAQLGGETTLDPIQKQDEVFANVLEDVICPRIYRLLSDMLPAVSDDTAVMSEEKINFVANLTKCFSDCAAILVIDHRRLDWSTFIGSFGKMSWSRLGDDRGRLQVGLHFMLNVARSDPSAFSRHEEEFVLLLLQALVTASIGIEYDFFVTVMSVPKAAENPMLASIDLSYHSDIERFMEHRSAILEVILMNIADQLQSRLEWAKSRKSFFYQCLNLLVSSLSANVKGINEARVLHKEEYRAFVSQVLATMRRILGEGIVQPSVIPSLRHLL